MQGKVRLPPQLPSHKHKIRLSHYRPAALFFPHQLIPVPGLPHAALAAGMRQLDTDLAALPKNQSGAADSPAAQVYRCQSPANPSRTDYWHIGETTIRLPNIISLIVNG